MKMKSPIPSSSFFHNTDIKDLPFLIEKVPASKEEFLGGRKSSLAP
jgi:hypothetical protein